MKFLRYNDKEGIIYDDFTERYVAIKKDSLDLLQLIQKKKKTSFSKDDLFRIKRLIELDVLTLSDKGLFLSSNTRFSYVHKELVSPFVAYWLITNKCNFHCKHCCWGQHKALDEELSLQESLDMIDQLVELGIVRLSISGGEPLCEYDKLQKSVKWASQKGVNSICIATNGSLLNSAKISALVQAGVTEFQFSIDDDDPAIHNMQRGMNNYEHIKECIEIIKSLNCNVSAGVTIHKKNLNKIEFIVDSIVSILGISKVKLVRYLPIVKDEYTRELEIFDPADIARAVSQMQNLQAKYIGKNVDIKIPAIAQTYGRFLKFEEKLESSCEALKLRMCIMANGNISPCPILSSLDVVVGNIRNHSVADILLSDKAKEITEWRGKDDCATCEYYKYCAGGCLANSINYHNNTTTADKWCLQEYKKYL